MSLSRKEKVVIFVVMLFACVIVAGSRVYEIKQSEPKAKNRFLRIHFLRLIQALISRAVIMPMMRWL